MPVRIIRREHQHVLAIDFLDQPRQLGPIRRSVKGLDGQPHMLPSIIGRRFVEPRHLGPHRAPGLVRPPHPGRQPGHTGLQQHDLQPGEFGENPLGNKAVQHPREAGGPRNVVLQIIGRPAEIGRRMPIRTAGMHANRQIRLLRRAVNRPVRPAPERNLRHLPQQHLHKAAIRGTPFDLLCRQFRAVLRHDDGGPQPVVPVQPLPRHPIVDRSAERRRQVLAENGRGAVQHVADGETRAEPVQRLRLQRVEIRSWEPLGGPPVRPAVDGRVHRERGGVVIVLVQTTHFHMRAPVVVQIGQQDMGARQRRMDVAIDRA